MNFFKRLYGIITNPRNTFIEISKEPKIWEAIVILVILPLISTLIIFNRSVFIKNIGPGIDPFTIDKMLNLMPVFIVFGVFGAMIITPIYHFIGTSVYNLLCEFFGYKGNGKGLFTTLAFASTPSLFSTILYPLFILLDLNILSVIFSLGIAIWIVVLKIFAIKETYSISGGKATLIYFIPLLTLIVIIGILIILGLISLVPIIQQFSTII